MLMSRLITRSFGKISVLSTTVKPEMAVRMRLFASESKSSTLRRVKEVSKGPTLKERLMAPAGESAFTAGRGLLAGASLLGLGSLCYYGLGLSDQVGAIDRAALWPSIVKERIRGTYAYFGGSLLFTATSAVLLSRSPAFMNIMMRSSWLTLLGSIGAMMGTGILCQSLPYTDGISMKHLAWMLHSCVVGAVVAPIALMGGPLLVRAACYTAGVVGGLSALAMCAPSDKFLYMGGPLAMGLGVVFISSIGTWFLPPSTALGAGLYSVAVYGGLALFGMFLLYDTQKVVYRAEHHVAYADRPFDPINNSVGIYMDTINIFIRIAMILAGGNNRRK